MSTKTPTTDPTTIPILAPVLSPELDGAEEGFGESVEVAPVWVGVVVAEAEESPVVLAPAKTYPSIECARIVVPLALIVVSVQEPMIHLRW
jgi:hypothetical protein